MPIPLSSLCSPTWACRKRCNSKSARDCQARAACGLGCLGVAGTARGGRRQRAFEFRCVGIVSASSDGALPSVGAG
eukprot:3053067-Lingulodinium_polyedra.AAC.1